MARVTPFSIGQRWYCDRSNNNSYSLPNFTFVIVGPGHKAGEKLCRLESDDPEHDKSHGSEEYYSHAHLKKYAKHVV